MVDSYTDAEKDKIRDVFTKLYDMVENERVISTLIDILYKKNILNHEDLKDIVNVRHNTRQERNNKIQEKIQEFIDLTSMKK